jgi:hypothetical protein
MNSEGLILDWTEKATAVAKLRAALDKKHSDLFERYLARSKTATEAKSRADRDVIEDQLQLDVAKVSEQAAKWRVQTLIYRRVPEDAATGTES